MKMSEAYAMYLIYKHLQKKMKNNLSYSDPGSYRRYSEYWKEYRRRVARLQIISNKWYDDYTIEERNDLIAEYLLLERSYEKI